MVNRLLLFCSIETNEFCHLANEFSRTKAWKAEPANQSSLPLPSDTLIARTAVTPKTRIVVVRTTSSIQNENGEDISPEEPTRSKSVELPPMFTNGVCIISSKRFLQRSNFLLSVHRCILFDDQFNQQMHQKKHSSINPMILKKENEEKRRPLVPIVRVHQHQLKILKTHKFHSVKIPCLHTSHALLKIIRIVLLFIPRITLVREVLINIVSLRHKQVLLNETNVVHDLDPNHELVV